MNNMTNVQIAEAVLDALRNDPVISEYVKIFSVGRINVSRKIFPYIAVEAPEKESDSRTMGQGGYVNNLYTIRLFAGTYHTLPEIAHAGNGKDKKGILQLNSDILSVVLPNDFGGVFAAPVRLMSSSTAHKVSSGARLWITMVVLSGRRKKSR